MDTTEAVKPKVRRAPRKKAAAGLNALTATTATEGMFELEADALEWPTLAVIPGGAPEQVHLREVEDAAILAFLENGARTSWYRSEQLFALVQRYGGLKTLLRQDFEELRRAENLGEDSAVRVFAAIEAARRLNEEVDTRAKLRTPKEIYAYLAPDFAQLRKEAFHVLCFNCRNTLLRNVRIAEGTTDSCPVDPREVFAAALAVRASSLILVHNHPSGEPDPSTVDLALTEQLVRGAQLLGMTVTDHLVLGDGRYYSFLEHNLLPRPGRSLRQACQGPGER